MSIPKIAISNEFDSSLQIFQSNSPTLNKTPTPPSPGKPIIKNRSSQPPTPSSTSTTTQTYFTCPTRLDTSQSTEPVRKSSIKSRTSDQNQIKKQTIDENDTEFDVSELSHVENPQRRGTISTTSVLPSKPHSNETIHKRAYSLRKNRSFSAVNNENASVLPINKTVPNSFIPNPLNPPPPLPYAERSVRNSLTQMNNQQRQTESIPIRRTNSCRPPSSSAKLKRFVVRDGKLIEQDINDAQPVIKRRSTFDNFTSSMSQYETPIAHELTRPEDTEQYIKSNSNNSIRLVTDTNLSMQSAVNDQSDMQLNLSKQNRRTLTVSLNKKLYFIKQCLTKHFL